MLGGMKNQLAEFSNHFLSQMLPAWHLLTFLVAGVSWPSARQPPSGSNRRENILSESDCAACVRVSVCEIYVNVDSPYR